MIEVPLNVGLRADRLAYTLNQAECQAIVILGEWAPRVDAIRGALTCDPHDDRGRRPRRGHRPVTPFADLLTADAARPSTVVSPEDTSVLLFTSGTTGRRRGSC